MSSVGPVDHIARTPPGAERMLPCAYPYCDKPAVVFAADRYGDEVVLLVRLDFARVDHPVNPDHRAAHARCLDHAHDELDRAVEQGQRFQARHDRLEWSTGS